MKQLTLLLPLAFLLCGTAVPAVAQIAEFGLAGGPNTLQGKDLSAASSLDDGWNLIFRITINNDTIFGQEFGYGYNRSGLVFEGQDLGGMAIHQGFYNFLLYGTKEGTRIRPFVTGGGHFSNFVPPGQSAVQGGGDNKFGVNYGAGVKFRVTDRWLIRGDFRQYLQGKPFGDFLPVSGSVRINQISFGFAFTL